MGTITRFSATFIFAFALLARVTARQQDMKPISESISSALPAQEPGWELQHSVVRENEILHRWGYRYELCTISVKRTKAVDEATSQLEGIPRMISLAAPAQRRTDIGDDALMYSRYGPTGSAVVYFRKGPMIADVGCPSEHITIRVARLVASNIYATFRATNARKDDIPQQPHFTVRAPSGDYASFVDESIPRTMIAGQTYSATVTFRNTGANVWSTRDGYALTVDGPDTSRAWAVTAVPLPYAATTDQEVVFTLNLNAPVTPGTHSLQFTLKKGSAPFGGLSVTIPVNVR